MPAIIYSDTSNETIVGRTNDQTITGQKTFLSAVAASVPLRVRGTTGQTGNLTEWRDSADALTAYVNPTGAFVATNLTINGNNNSGIHNLAGNHRALTVGPDTGVYSKLHVTVQDAGQNGVTVKAAASQTGNLMAFVNSAGSGLTWVRANGSVHIGSPFTQAASVGLTISGGNGSPAAGTVAFGDGSGWMLNFNTNAGTSTRFASLDDKGNMVLNGNLQITANTANQGLNNQGLMIGNDLWIYDVNQGNSIGFSGAGNPEAATIILGRSTNNAPRIGGNDVNKTLALITNGGPVSTSNALTVENNDLSIRNGVLYAGWTNGTGTTYLGATIDIQTYQAGGVGGKGIAIIGQPGQTGRYIEVMNSAQTVLGYVDIYGQWVYASSASIKENVSTMDRSAALTGVMALRPVNYHLKGETGRLQQSFIAEEAAEVLPEIVDFEEGAAVGIRQNSLLAILTATVQEQQARIENLETLLKGE